MNAFSVRLARWAYITPVAGTPGGEVYDGIDIFVGVVEHLGPYEIP